MKENSLTSILIRYFVLLVVAIPNLWLFYLVFKPLTVYPVYWLLSIFYDTLLISGNIIMVNLSIPIELIGACIAGSAYYLLLILNLSVPGIKIKKRIKMLAMVFLTFLIINILRIFFLSTIAISGSNLFDITHRLFWYVLSTVIVVALWFAEVKIFKIKTIPVYSDMKFLYKLGKKKR